MKRFLINCLIFSIILVAILCSVEFGVRSLPNILKYKQQWMERNVDSLELLILGSSHSYYGIDPKPMDFNAFNLAYASQSLRYDYLLLNNFIDEAVSLKYVVLPISYFSFVGNMEESEEWWRIIHYNLYMSCPPKTKSLKYQFELARPTVALLKILKSIEGRNLDVSERGLGTNYNLEDRARKWDNGVERAKFHTKPNLNPSIIKENAGYLDSIAELTRKHNVELILVTLPARPSYYNSFNPEQLDIMYSTIGKVTEKYDNLHYIDLLRYELTDDDFYDGDHLSTQGGAKMGKYISDIIRSGQY